MTSTLPPVDLDRSPPAASLPRHRVILAVDIEQSTSRPDRVKAELRRTLYELFDQALQSAGIRRRHRDRFTDRGDGLLALIHPVDQVAKPVLLNQVVPALSQLLADYNASSASASSCTPEKSTTTATDVSAKPSISPSASSTPPA
jgi:hypothetical protein